MLIKFLLNGKEIDLTGDNVIIKSNNFNVDKDGNMSCKYANITGGKISIGNKLNIDEEGNIIIGGDEEYPGLISKDSISETSFFPLGIMNTCNGQYACVNKGGLGVGYDNGISIKETTTISVEGIKTNNITQTSLESQKKNFERLENGLAIVNNTEIYKYNLKSQNNNEKKHIGFVIGKNYKYSNEITAIDKDGREIGVDTYSMISVAYKAIQEQQEIIEQLQNKVKELEGK